MKVYIIRIHFNNGETRTYTPFYSSRELADAKVDEMIKEDKDQADNNKWHYTVSAVEVI